MIHQVYTCSVYLACDLCGGEIAAGQATSADHHKARYEAAEAAELAAGAEPWQHKLGSARVDCCPGCRSWLVRVGGQRPDPESAIQRFSRRAAEGYR